MIPFYNNNFENKNETPVTNLSKRFSMTQMNEKRTSEPVIYMDESANQEPPSFDAFSTVVFPSFGDDFNSCSSGYYSNSSASAPSTCNTIADPCSYKTATNGSSYKNVKLRRCHSTSWLSKRRTKKETVPVISRIVRRSSLNPASPKKDLFHEEDVEKTQIISSLSSVPEKPEPMVNGNSTMEINPTTPAKGAKRARLTSISASDMDSTQILPATVLQNIGTISTEWSRHHSTPTSRFKRVHQPNNVMSPLSSNNFSKPMLSRFHSVPVPHVNSDAQIGDMLPASLPVTDKTSSGLNCISAKTLNDVIEGRYAKKNISYTIIDCRFPYEYEGGHIKGAKNLYTQDKVLYNVFTQVPAKDPSLSSGYVSLADELSKKLDLNDESDVSTGDMNADVSVSFTQDELEKMAQSTREECLPTYSIDESSVFEFNAADELHHDILQASMDHSRTRHSSTSDYTQLLSFSACSDHGDKSDVNLPQAATTDQTANSIPVIIFHCEFSSQRAPSLATFLRSIDRTSNFHRYPFLYFPEIYILKGGYSEFYKTFPDQCTPRLYRTMFDRSYHADLIFEKRMTKRVTEACISLLKNYKDSKSTVPNIIPHPPQRPPVSATKKEKPYAFTRPRTCVNQSNFPTIFQELSSESSSESDSERQRDIEFKRKLFDMDPECCSSSPTEDLGLVGQIIKVSRRICRYHKAKFVYNPLPADGGRNRTPEDKENNAPMMTASPLCNTKPMALVLKTPTLTGSDLFKSFEMSATPNTFR